MMTLNFHGRKWSWPVVMLYSNICLKVLRRAAARFTWARSSEPKIEPGTFKYEAAILTITLRPLIVVLP